MTPRGACPSLAAPMRTGDGLLARLGGGAHWTPEAALRMAGAAQAFGNGTLEVTARGSWQARGLRPETAAPFAAALADLGGEAAVAVNPLAGADPGLVDPRPVAEAVLAGLGAVAPKLSVVVDGGGALHLDALAADLRLVAEGGAWRLSLGPAALGLVAAPAETALRVLAVLGTRRARDVQDLAPFLAALEGLLRPAPPARPRPPVEPLGVHRLGNFVALGVAPAFGSLEAARLADLARAARDLGADGLRPAPGRALLVTGLLDAAPMREAAAALGLITDPADPRRRVVACPGAPACGSGHIATRPLAATLAGALDRSPGQTWPPGAAWPPGSAQPPGQISLHVSGCAKGCAHPGTAALTLVGGADGVGVVRDGTAREVPSLWLTEREAAALLPPRRGGDTSLSPIPLPHPGTRPL